MREERTLFSTLNLSAVLEPYLFKHRQQQILKDASLDTGACLPTTDLYLLLIQVDLLYYFRTRCFVWLGVEFVFGFKSGLVLRTGRGQSMLAKLFIIRW